jgi:hypothetical protein
MNCSANHPANPPMMIAAIQPTPASIGSSPDNDAPCIGILLRAKGDNKRLEDQSRALTARAARAQAHTVDWSAVIDERIANLHTFLLDVVAHALGEALAEQHRDAKHELEDNIRGLKIELAQLEATLSELRSVIASEKSQVVDLPSSLRRVN